MSDDGEEGRCGQARLGQARQGQGRSTVAAYGVVGGTEERAVTSDCDTRDRHILLGNQLVRAVVLAQIPDAYAPAAVTADNLALVRVNYDVVRGGAVVVTPLYRTAPRLPDLDGSVLGARHHPLALAMEGYPGDVARMALEGQ